VRRVPFRTIVVAAAAALCGGCSIFRSPLGPVPPPLSRAEVVRLVGERSRRFVTVRDTGISLNIWVMTEKGMKKQPSLGGVLAFDSLRPGLWLRAEKLGQKVFNLRAGADYFWLELPDTREVVTGSRAAYTKLPELIEPYEVMFWFASPEWLGLTWDSTQMFVEPEHYRFDVRSGNLLMRRVYVDRRRVAVSRIVDYDLLGRVSTVVRLESYRETGGVLFPRRLVVERVLAGYRIELRLGRPQFNRPIDPRAFAPAKRPGWRHIDLDREPVSAVKAFRGER